MKATVITKKPAAPKKVAPKTTKAVTPKKPAAPKKPRAVKPAKPVAPVVEPPPIVIELPAVAPTKPAAKTAKPEPAKEPCAQCAGMDASCVDCYQASQARMAK